MYDNPLAIYREYIQNAADAFVNANYSVRGKVSIKIDPLMLRINIQDNGPGLSYVDAISALIPIANSQKTRGASRGFRGIGRLSGLAFAESVTFLTRTQGNLPVTRIIWNGVKLKNHIFKTNDLGQAIQDCIEVDTFSGDQYPDEFFEVEMTGVARHAAVLLLNREAVRSYISQVCPVPMSNSFPFASEISKLNDGENCLYTLDVYLDDDPKPVLRKHDASIQFTENRHDRFSNLEKFQIPSVDGKKIAAAGWVAHSSYLGAIPKEAGIRGIRARDGNIQVGDENVFDHLFFEERFNRWCVGEVHIFDSRIVPNGRRDYFEPSPHTRNLENYLGDVVRRIIEQCRKTSKARSKERNLSLTLCQFESSYELAISGYFFPDDAKALVQETLEQIQRIRQKYSSANNELQIGLKKLDVIENQFMNFQVKRGRPSLDGVPQEQIATYRQVFKVLMEISPSAQDAKKAIEAVLSHTNHTTA